MFFFNNSFNFRAHVFVVLYFLTMLGVCQLSYKKPDYNWDMLAYTAVVLQYDHQAKDIHQEVYQLALKQLPADTYNLLTLSNAYRKKWSVDAEAFRQTLPFYVVKPLYTLVAYLFFKLGVPVFKATVIPSLIAYLMTGTLLLVWLSRYLTLVPAIIICSLIMLLPPIVEAAKFSSPDLLAGMLIFYAIYFLVENISTNAFFIFSMLAMLSRIDFILPILILLGSITLQARAISIRKMMLFMCLTIMTYLLISSNAYRYGWNILYFPSFINTLNPRHEVHSVFTLYDYWEILKAQVSTALYYSHIAWFLLLSALTLLQFSRSELKSRKQAQIVGALLIVLAVRFLLQPVIADRFYIGYYLVVLCLFIINTPLNIRFIRNSKEHS